MKGSGPALTAALLVLTATALACRGGSGTVSPTPSTPTASPTAAAPPTPASSDEEMLASMALTLDEVTAASPDRQWGESEALNVRELTEQDRQAGVLAGWAVQYNADAGVQLTTGLELYETTERASKSLETVLEGLNQDFVDEFDAGEIGDETQGLIIVPTDQKVYVDVFLRVGRVLAFLDLASANPEKRDEVTAFAAKLAERIRATPGGGG